LCEAIKASGLKVPTNVPQKWVVDCKHVGTGEKALVYLGRYLYRGVIREKDIIACTDGKVTFRYLHIPAEHEHSFRRNVNTDSGST
jgi:hypothetical protein